MPRSLRKLQRRSWESAAFRRQGAGWSRWSLSTTLPRASYLAGLAFGSSGLSTPAVFQRSWMCSGFLPTGRVGHGAARTAAAAICSCSLEAGRGCVSSLDDGIGHQGT